MPGPTGQPLLIPVVIARPPDREMNAATVDAAGPET
jgi:hypothetical protein